VLPVTKVQGPNDPTNPGLEAELDIQYIMGIATNVPTWFISTPGEHEGQEPFLTWITTLLDTPDIPYVYSVSYGDVESSLSISYTQRINVEFMKFGILGYTLIFASGDDGVGCNGPGTRQEPNFPASSPYVTAVGGVVLGGINPLQIFSDEISSGGFSNYFSTGAFQSATITNYFATATDLPPASYYNRSGRGYPDVASFSENVVIVFQGGQTYVGGTSCASPVFSAIISLINDQRLSAGKVPLGYLNPIIYTIAPRYPDAFYDVTQGQANSDGQCQGFAPKVGWDPITGWGVPNFNRLAVYLG